MACGLLSSPAMPIDALYPLGTSPPMPSLFLPAQRYTATSFMYLADKTSGNGVQPMGECSKTLRPCLRESLQKTQTGDTTNDVHSEGKSMGNLDHSADATGNPCNELTLVNLCINDDVGTGKPRPSKLSPKHVSFADSKGLALASVRVMDGPSNMPPLLKSRLLQEIIQDEKPKLFPAYTYVTDFQQPAANYLEFRDQLEKHCVSLENVVIKDNSMVMGTVKVKNISFEKSVIVRVSFDKWESCRDIPATYVQQSPSGQADRYDTFSFSFVFPTKMEGGSVEFCVRYNCRAKSYWDNNGGKNYCIISEHEKSLTVQQKMACYSLLSSRANWGDFSYWKVTADERPYW